jgi:hypothetical protein
MRFLKFYLSSPGRTRSFNLVIGMLTIAEASRRRTSNMSVDSVVQSRSSRRSSADVADGVAGDVGQRWTSWLDT